MEQKYVRKAMLIFSVIGIGSSYYPPASYSTIGYASTVTQREERPREREVAFFAALADRGKGLGADSNANKKECGRLNYFCSTFHVCNRPWSGTSVRSSVQVKI